MVQRFTNAKMPKTAGALYRRRNNRRRATAQRPKKNWTRKWEKRSRNHQKLPKKAARVAADSTAPDAATKSHGRTRRLKGLAAFWDRVISGYFSVCACGRGI